MTLRLLRVCVETVTHGFMNQCVFCLHVQSLKLCVLKSQYFNFQTRHYQMLFYAIMERPSSRRLREARRCCCFGVMEPVNVSRYIAGLRAIGADWGQDTIMTTDNGCSFRLMKTRKIRS